MGTLPATSITICNKENRVGLGSIPLSVGELILILIGQLLRCILFLLENNNFVKPYTCCIQVIW